MAQTQPGGSKVIFSAPGRAVPEPGVVGQLLKLTHYRTRRNTPRRIRARTTSCRGSNDAALFFIATRKSSRILRKLKESPYKNPYTQGFLRAERIGRRLVKP